MARYKKRLKAYSSLSKIRKKLGFPRNSNIYEVKDGFLADYRVELKETPHYVSVSISSDKKSDLNEAVMIIETSLQQLLISKENRELLKRVEELQKKQPTSKFLIGMKEKLEGYEDLSEHQEEIIEEIEDRIQNPDPAFLSDLNEALRKNPTNRMLNSFKDQFLSGHSLSDKQKDILDRILNPPIDQVLLDRLEKIRVFKPSNFIDSLIDGVNRGYSLSPKQIAVVKRIEGRDTPTSPMESSAISILKDLKTNGLLKNEEYTVVNETLRDLERGLDIDPLVLKKIRHLLYKNTNRINPVPKDRIRKLFKKALYRTIKLGKL